MTATGARVSGAELIERAKALAPAFRARGDEIEAARRLPSDLVAAMREAGLFHLFATVEAGGLECHPVAACQVIEEVSRADGSAGWCVMIAAQNAAISGFVEPTVARGIWGNGGIMAGSARPIGKATRDGDGYRVSGRWPLASGSSHATVLAGESVVYEGGEAVRDADGNTPSYFAIVPTEQAVIHDTWYTTGLRGTASNDFSFEDVYVPASHFVGLGEPYSSWPMVRSLALMFTSHGAQALGVASAAIETAIAVAKTKIGWGTDRPMTENLRLQGQVAEAVVLVESAREHMLGAAQRLWDALERGEQPGLLNARVRLATSHAATASVRAVDLMHGALATTSIYAKSPLERQFRDIHTAAAHVMVGPLTYEAAGRVEMGLPAGVAFFE
jgi:alkylation response protein AidB-like acyl-CoA dehydrogenase